MLLHPKHQERAMRRNMNRLLTTLLILFLMSGCGGCYRNSEVSDADISTLMSAVSDHPSAKTIPTNEIGSIYNDGDSWRVEFRRFRRRRPVLWFRVDKTTKQATPIE
jgi:hypothetical protein